MKRLYITYYNIRGLGGAETLYSRIVKYLAENEQKVHMIASEDDFAYRQNSKNSNIVRIPVDGRYLQAKNLTLSEIRNIRKLVRSYFIFRDIEF